MIERKRLWTVLNLPLVPLAAAAAGGVLHRHYSYAAVPVSAEQVPGSVPDSLIQQARFPEGFLWGTRHGPPTRWKAHGMRTARANLYGTDSLIHLGK